MLIGEHTIGDPPGIGDSYVTLTMTYTMDQYIVFTGVEPLDPGFRYSLNRNSDLYLMDRITNPYDMYYAVGKQDVFKSYSFSTALLKSLTGLSIDVILRPSYESTIPSTSVIDALVWSYAEIFDEVWRQMETMANALKLDYAQSTDLDIAWGQIYDLPRLVNEDDTNYRDRLKTRTIILNSSGTKQNCETIIDSIIGIPSTTIISRYPAMVDIVINSDDAIRIAKEKISTLELLIPQMLADGISYNMILPLLDYTIDNIIKGSQNCPCNIYLYLNYHNIDNRYSMNNILSFLYDFELDIDYVSKKVLYKTLMINNILLNYFNKSYSINNVLKKPIEYMLNNNIRIKKYNNLYNYSINQYVFKTNNIKTYSIDNVSAKSKNRRNNMSIILV